MTSRPVCPECATPVEVDWEWCHGCGFDPEGKLAEARAEGREPSVLTTPPSAAVSPPIAPPIVAPVSSAVSPAAAFPGAAPVSAVSPLADADSWHDEPRADEALATTVPSSSYASTDELASGGSFGSADEFATDTSFEAAPTSFEAAPTSFENDPFDAGGIEDLAPPPAPFFVDVAPPVAPEPAPAALTGGFAPDGWQNDPPPPRPEGVLNPKAGGPKTPVLIALGAIAVLVVGFTFVKMGSNERPKADTSNGPPPAGAVALNTTPSTVPPVTVAAGWVQYRSPDGRYVAGFPMAPAQKNVFVVLGSRNIPAVEVGAQVGPAAPAYAVDTVEIPVDFPIPDAQAAFDLLSQHFEVIASQPYSVNGFDGVRFTARSNGADLTGLVYVRGARMYYLAAVGADPASFVQFASSFQLTKG